MARWGMVIDLDRCTACQACTVACKAENNVPFAGPIEMKRGRRIAWNDFLVEVSGEYPEVEGKFIPMPCMHCDNPPCVKVCPIGATYRNEEGIVLQRYERCFGCRLCMQACPYNRRYFNWYKAQFEDIAKMQRAEYPDRRNPKNYQNPAPETKPRPKGIVEKCTFCIQRIRNAKRQGKRIGSDYADGVAPACVQTCTGGARVFGDLDDKNSKVSKLARANRAFRLLDDLGTMPKVIYLS